MRFFLLFLVSFCLYCGTPKPNNSINTEKQVFKKTDSVISDSVTLTPSANLILAADKTSEYYPILTNKRIGIVTNPTGTSSNGHIVDVIHEQFNVLKVFAPEHGFRGNADAGEIIKDGKDIKTGLPIISLYGKNKKPYPSQINDLDIIIFDIQDVGARFYTYISTLHYVMEACAENNVEIIVLDRPNPNGHIVDGPVLKSEYKSFVGMHPIPILHGMTIGEYAMMINGERWLKGGIKASLKVISMSNYSRNDSYSLPIAPSPNLRSDQAINLYPSLCFFEGTTVNAGRGTPTPFEVYGSPTLKNQSYTYTPVPSYGSKNPKNNGKLCHGRNLSSEAKLNQLELKWLIDAYTNSNNKNYFFNSFFNKLAGNSSLKKQIISGKTEQQIRDSWKIDLDRFKSIRQKYLIYN